MNCRLLNFSLHCIVMQFSACLLFRSHDSYFVEFLLVHILLYYIGQKINMDHSKLIAKPHFTCAEHKKENKYETKLVNLVFNLVEYLSICSSHSVYHFCLILPKHKIQRLLPGIKNCWAAKAWSRLIVSIEKLLLMSFTFACM